MICVENVKSLVKTIGGYEDNELDRFDILIENIIDTLNSQLKNPSYCNDARIEMLAATTVNYQLVIVENDGVTSFKAGDLSVTQSGYAAMNAKTLLDNAKENATDLIIDSGFAFLGV